MNNLNSVLRNSSRLIDKSLSFDDQNEKDYCGNQERNRNIDGQSSLGNELSNEIEYCKKKQDGEAAAFSLQ